jgi:hypothetical protein
VAERPSERERTSSVATVATLRRSSRDDCQAVPHLAFRVAEVFPANDPLSEWLVTIALAMNDLTVVHDRLEEDQDEPHKAFYWQRLALSHFTEAALFLHDTANVAGVTAFVESLGAEARARYDECQAVFEERRGQLFDTRNKATFHYPELRPANPQADRPVREALRAMRDDRAVIRLGRIRDARSLFADDVVAHIFARAVGGLDAVAPFDARVAEGVTAFIDFTNLAVDEHLVRARESGVAFEEVEPVDPEDLWRGWRPRSSE